MEGSGGGESEGIGKGMISQPCIVHDDQLVQRVPQVLHLMKLVMKQERKQEEAREGVLSWVEPQLKNKFISRPTPAGVASG